MNDKAVKIFEDKFFGMLKEQKVNSDRFFVHSLCTDHYVGYTKGHIQMIRSVH